MNEQLKAEINQTLARYPDANFSMTVSTAFMDEFGDWVKRLPQRVRVKIDDYILIEIKAFTPELVEMSAVGGIFLVNETMIKHEIEQSVRVGLWRSLGIYNQFAGRVLRPNPDINCRSSATPELRKIVKVKITKSDWVAPCDHSECSKDGFHDENGKLRWVCRK